MKAGKTGVVFHGLLEAIAKEYSSLESENAALRLHAGSCEIVGNEWDHRTPVRAGGVHASGAVVARSSTGSLKQRAKIFDGIHPINKTDTVDAKHMALSNVAVTLGYQATANRVRFGDVGFNSLSDVSNPPSTTNSPSNPRISLAADRPATENVSHKNSSFDAKPITDDSMIDVSDVEVKCQKTQFSTNYADLDPQLALCRVCVRLGVSSDGDIDSSQLHKTMLGLGLCQFTLAMWDGFLRVVHETYGRLSQKEASLVTNQSIYRRSISAMDVTHTWKKSHMRVPVTTLVHAMSAPQEANFKVLSPEHCAMMSHLRNVLYASETNLLIAELTNVQIDDLCSTPPKNGLLDRMEPFVAVTVILNGIVVGCQAEKDWEGWPGWGWVNVLFAVIYLIEFLFRLIKQGSYTSFVGREKMWSYFDFTILLINFADIFVAFVDSATLDFIGFVRILRMCRLVRLLRIFRLRIMRDLTLMVKGLISGLKTLVWAFVLLFVFIYFMAVCMMTFLQNDSFPEPMEDGEPWQEQWMFASVPRAMLMIFRCFTGDCVDGWGFPLVQRFTDMYGWAFVAAYLVGFVIVTFGLFNLIIGLYVENTLTAARIDDAASKSHSLQVAHRTRELLAKFCIAQTALDERGTRGLPDLKDVKDRLAVSDTSSLTVEDVDIVLSKEVFLLVIQDQGVQKLMNDLDIPADRANLFDIFDTKCSGKVLVSELVHGLLKIRGGPKKCDIVAVLLAVQAMQRQVLAMNALLKRATRSTDPCASDASEAPH
eukprot:TRINITY_DN14174_c1_g1_i1.p1 TRINITY_DN14174_c1_g1~~TRINITY_DN14174_c1_g1_i1.p1  ORF type:complete len:810 (+),score=97.42 TRINITY_DN14174_c1_g1_i1:134-2431(+)